ncbi:MAG: preprotein translocase subunit YajC [Alphaproteobacteria bacterium]|nr:preprotein translocase subunit YajC [Alphaproteobacteria bacterium]
MFISPAYAQVPGATGTETFLVQILPIILIFFVLYFLLFRPQQKKAKEHAAMVDAVKRGDQVVTAGGILGKVTKVGEEGRITVEIAPNVKVEVLKSTLADVLSKPVPADSDRAGGAQSPDGKRKDKSTGATAAKPEGDANAAPDTQKANP